MTVLFVNACLRGDESRTLTLCREYLEGIEDVKEVNLSEMRREPYYGDSAAYRAQLEAKCLLDDPMFDIGKDVAEADEIVIGDNDTLSAIVSATVSADLLILLSDIDGLYDRDPRRDPDAKLIETVPVIDAHILSLAGDKGSELATGGMVTKLHAAQIATAAGCEMVIANGEKPEVLYDIVGGKRVGTRILIPKSEEELL